MSQPLPPEVYGEPPTTLDYRNADTTLVATGFDLAAGAECQAGTGKNAPPGTTNFGFSDTTYSPTLVQILRQTTTGQY